MALRPFSSAQALGFLVALALGLLLTRQFFAYRAIRLATQPETVQSVSLEVASLYSSVDKLTREQEQLIAENDKLNQALSDRRTTSQNINETLSQYKAVSGLTRVQGQGVDIFLEKKLEVPQLVDLINALRNIGVEAVAVNGVRVTPTFGFDSETFASPYTVSAIGDSSLLESSLKRRGGILERLDQETRVVRQENIVLPASR